MSVVFPENEFRAKRAISCHPTHRIPFAQCMATTDKQSGKSTENSVATRKVGQVGETALPSPCIRSEWRIQLRIIGTPMSHDRGKMARQPVVEDGDSPLPSVRSSGLPCQGRSPYVQIVPLTYAHLLHAKELWRPYQALIRQRADESRRSTGCPLSLRSR